MARGDRDHPHRRDAAHGAYRAELPGSEPAGRADLAARGGTLRIADHTFVPPEIARARASPQQLVEALVADARERGLQDRPAVQLRRGAVPAPSRMGRPAGRRPTAERSAGQAREVDRGDRVRAPPSRISARVVERDAADLERAAGDAELEIGIAAPPRERALRDLDRLQLDARGDVEPRREPAAADVEPLRRRSRGGRGATGSARAAAKSTRERRRGQPRPADASRGFRGQQRPHDRQPRRREARAAARRTARGRTGSAGSGGASAVIAVGQGRSRRRRPPARSRSSARTARRRGCPTWRPAPG